MAERYKRLYDLGGARYADGAPLLICAGALLQDRLSQSTLVQLKMKNISDTEIVAVKMAIEAFNPAGELLENIEYIYQGFRAKRDQDFGMKTAVVIPDQSASTFVPSVKQVMFSDGSIWEEPDSQWTEVKAPRTLNQVFGDEELSTQFAIRYGNDCTYFPEENRDLWFCACGLINHMDEPKCHGCRRVYSALKAVNFASLRNESAQRQETEKQQEDENKAEQQSRKKKYIILSLVLIPIIVCLILVLATVPKYMAQKNDYAAAEALLSAGKYDQAKEAFLALGDYADSDEQANYNVAYQKALYVMECAKEENIDGLLMLGMKRSELAEGETVGVALYKAADSLFAELGDYADSEIQRQAAQAAVKAHYDAMTLAEYESAKALLEEGSYLAARDAFLAMGDYADCKELAQDALYRRAVRIYELTEKYPMRGVFSKISSTTGVDSVFYITEDAFAQLGSTASGEIRDIFRNDGVAINIENPPAEGFIPICTDISRIFKEMGNYKDSADYVNKAIEAGDFTKPFYELCESGRLYDAYVWLKEFEEEFDARDKWMNVLETYVRYCGSWELKGGDPTLIPMTVGIQTQCLAFTSAVIIKDYVITLNIYVNGDTAYPIQLPLAAEGGRFSVNADGVNTYIAAISNTGNFNYSRYSSYAISPQNNSCEYVRVG